MGAATAQLPLPSGPPPAPSPSSAFVPSPVAQTAPPPAPAPQSSNPSVLDRLIGKSERVTVTIAAIGHGRDNALRITTTEGKVIDQLDDNRSFAAPSPGDQLIVERRLMGYRCQLDKHTYFTCKPKGA